ncbi:MAG: hypothetical protein K9N06_04185 [Candidatus Cloacimonetes bacterium]|nr:hypothetical protein [Candidatus Cloacimonadota bacterium]
MTKKNIENYIGPRIPKKREFLSANNIVSVISIGLISITLSCSPTVKIVDTEPVNPEIISTNSPSPFMPTTTIKYKIENQTELPDTVSVKLYDVKAKLVRTLINEIQVSGEYQCEWDGKNDDNIHVKSGVYCYSIEINGKEITTRKILLLK